MALPGVYKEFNDRWCKQTIWLYSDTHFGDTDLADGICGRPGDKEHLARLNAKIGRKDTLIHLGDVGDIEIAKHIRGYKILIMGNHDLGRTKYEEVFDEIYEGPLIIGERLILSHEPINIPYFFNIHGHVHDRKQRDAANQFNCCSDAIGYEPVNFNQWLKQGHLSSIKSIHRYTIDSATKRKNQRTRWI